MGKRCPGVKVRLASDAFRVRVRHCLPPPQAVDPHFSASRRHWGVVRLEPRCRQKEATPKEVTPLDTHPRPKLPSVSFAWLFSAVLLLYIALDKLSCLGAAEPPASACPCPCVPAAAADALREAGSLGGTAGAPEPSAGSDPTVAAPGDPGSGEEAAAAPEAGRRLQAEAEGGGAAANETSAGEATSGGDEHGDPEDALPFLFTAIGVGTALAQLSTYSRFQWLQQTVMLFMLGMFYSVLVDLGNLKKFTHGFLGVSHHMWMNIDPHLLLAVMLPILITGDSISIDTSVAKHVATQCAYLAGPGVVVCAFTLALFFWWYIPYQWPFMLCLTMSSILAATDPVAVVSLLKELGASPALTVQIQGESLLNDGTAMVLFTVAYNILRGEAYSFGDIVIFLVKSAVIAVLLGFAIGGACVLWIRMASNRLDSRSNLIQISITVCCAYWSWIVAEGTFHVSGVLCTVSSALVLAHCMWPHIVSKEAMHHVWHTFEHIGNSTIFFVAGSLTGHNMVRIPFMDYVHLLVIYVVCTLVRGAFLFASVPILNEVKHSCTEPVSMADATVMCWGGLRGALGLALAIKVNVDCADSRITPMDGERVLFYVGGVALLTLLVNATTCPMLVKWLRLNRPSGTKQMMMLNIHRQMSDFAAEQPVGKNAISNHIGKMLAEVERAINKSVDRSTVQNMQKITGPDVFRTASSTCTRNSTEKPMTESEMSELTETESSTTCRRCCRRVSEKKPSVLSTLNLAKRLTAARKRLQNMSPEYQGLLGISTPRLADGELEQIKTLLQNDGDWVSPLQQKPVNDVFLSLVRAKYWASIEADEFISCEGQCLLDSISGALGTSGYKLMDLHYIRRHLLKTFGEDHEVKRAVLMLWDQSPSTRGQSLFASQGSGDSDEGEQQHLKGCMYIISSVWYNAILILVISLTAGIGISICIVSNPEMYEPPVRGEMATVHVAFAIFILDFTLRLCALKGKTFQCKWRRLDAFLTMVCFIGSLLEILYYAGVIGDHILGSPLDEATRALMVLQLMRVHQLFKSVRTIRTLRRMATVATGSAPKHLAGRLQVIAILSAMARAHIQSQEELIKYFGTQGKVVSGIVARCIIESLTEVYDASYMAWCIGTTVSPAILGSLRTLRSCIHVTEDLCKLVEDAFHCGAMSEQDADSLLHPMKSHQYALREMVHTAHEGVIPRDLCTQLPVQMEEEYVVAKASTSSKWACCVGESCPERCSGLVSEGPPSDRLDSPRSFHEVGVQTGSDAESAAEGDAEAEIPSLQPAQARIKQLEDDVSEIRSDKDACNVVDSALQRCDCDVDPSQWEGWSVYTVDDLQPPQNLPGPQNTGISQDSTPRDVRL